MKLFFIVCSFFFAINMMAQEPMQGVVGLEDKEVLLMLVSIILLQEGRK